MRNNDLQTNCEMPVNDHAKFQINQNIPYSASWFLPKKPASTHRADSTVLRILVEITLKVVNSKHDMH